MQLQVTADNPAALADAATALKRTPLPFIQHGELELRAELAEGVEDARHAIGFLSGIAGIQTQTIESKPAAAAAPAESDPMLRKRGQRRPGVDPLNPIP